MNSKKTTPRLYLPGSYKGVIMNAAVYARVSTDLQAEKGYSLETQVQACTKKATELGANVIKTYVDDGYSGAYLERPQLDALRDAIADKLFDLVVIYEPDRLSRETAHLLLLTQEIERSGAKLEFVLTEYKNTPEGQLFLTIKGAFASYERATIRERTMRGKRGKLRQGKVVEDSGVYGYDYDSKNSCYIINPYEARVIQRIFKWYVSGEFGGCHTIADMLTMRKTIPPKGTRWHMSTVRSILRRQMYTGEYYANTYYHGKVGAKKEVRIPRDKSEWIPMKAPAIIDKDVFAKAQDKLSRNRSLSEFKRVAEVYLLRGLLFCEECGRKKHILRTEPAKGMVYYGCAARPSRYTSSIKCPSKYVNVYDTDAIFWGLLEKICKSEKFLLNYVKGQRSKSAAKSDSDVETYAKKLKDIAREREAVMQWFNHSLLTQEEATKRLTELKDSELVLQRKIENADSVKKESTLNASAICSMIKNCPATPEARRAVLLQIVNKIYMKRTDNSYKHHYKLEFRILFKD